MTRDIRKVVLVARFEDNCMIQPHVQLLSSQLIW